MKKFPSPVSGTVPASVPWKASSYTVAHDTSRAVTLVRPRSTTTDYAATRLSPRPVGRPQGGAALGVTTQAYMRSADSAWQAEVFAAYDQIPELRYTVNEISRATARCIVVPDTDARSGPEKPSTSRTSPTPPANAFPVSIVFRIAQLLTLVGECFLVSRLKVTGPAEIAVLSPVEIKRTSLYWELPAPWGIYDPKNPGNLRITRIHNPHPGCWERSDSAPRSLLPVLRELIGLTMHVSASIDSRLAGAGVFMYPMSAEVAAPSGDSSGQYDEDLPLGDAFMQAAITPISDRDTAAANAPILMGVPDDINEGLVKHITFATPLDAQVHALRDECIRRMALGMDAPPEVLLGMQNTASHFDTWAVQDDKVRTHIIPLLELIIEGVTVHMQKRYTFDVSPLQQKPNLGPEAIQAYDRGEISGESLRAAVGFSEEDAQSHAPTHENALAMTFTLFQKSPSLAQTPGLPAVYAQCMAILKGEAPENAIYPGQAIEVSEAETPRAPDDDLNEPDTNGRENPRSAPPASKPRTDAPRSDSSPDRGAGGRPRQRPSTGT